MRRYVIIAACFLIVGRPARSQSLELGGYLEHQVFPQQLAGRIVVMDYSKLRLDAGLVPFDWLTLTGDAVARVEQGKKSFSLLDYMPTTVVDAYADRTGRSQDDLAHLFAFGVDSDLYVDNAFATLYAGPVRLRAGRQQLPWGTGYAWNPSDVFHDKDLRDPTYEKRGVDAVKMEVPFAGMGLVTGVLSLDARWKRAKKAIRLRHHIHGFDWSLSLIEDFEDVIDYDTFSGSLERRRMLAGDFSGTLGEFGIWFEGTFSDMEKDASYTQMLFGADHTTEAGLYLMLEYYHNGKGTRSRHAFDLGRWMDFLGTNGENLGRDFIFAGQSLPLSDLLTGSNYVIYSLTDGSAVVYPYFQYSLSDNAELTLIGYVTFGRSDSEFGAFGSGAIVRARLYF